MNKLLTALAALAFVAAAQAQTAAPAAAAAKPAVAAVAATPAVAAVPAAAAKPAADAKAAAPAADMKKDAKPEGSANPKEKLSVTQHVLKVGPNVAHDVTHDFTAIVKTGNIPLLLVTSPSTGIKDARALIADAKAGKALTYGTPGAGSPMHIAAEMLNSDAGIKIPHVPYRGVAPVVTDTLGGHVSMGWITPGAVSSHIATGKLVALATAERQRTKLMPNVPTLVELGYKDLEISAWMGLLGPKGLPAEVQRSLNSHVNEVLKMPDVMARMAALGIEPIGGEPAVLSRQIADDDRRFGKLVKDFGIKAE